MPSAVLGLLLEREGERLHLIDAATIQRLLPAREQLAEAQAEADRLRRELEQLRQRLNENEG